MLRHFTPDYPGDGNEREFLEACDRAGLGKQFLARLTHDKKLLQECAELAGVKPGIEIEIHSGITMEALLKEKLFYMVHPDFRPENFPVEKGEPRKTRLVFLNFSLPRDVKKLKQSEVIGAIEAEGYKPAGTAEFIGLANWMIEKGFRKITFPFFEAFFLGSCRNYIAGKIPQSRSGVLSLRWSGPPLTKRKKELCGIALLLWEFKTGVDVEWPRENLTLPKKRKFLGRTLGDDPSSCDVTFAAVAKES